MPEPTMEAVGTVSGFFAKPLVAVVTLTGTLKVGESIYLKGHTTDFRQQVASMQVDHVSVSEAHAGQSIGLKVNERCRPHDIVYKLVG